MQEDCTKVMHFYPVLLISLDIGVFNLYMRADLQKRRVPPKIFVLQCCVAKSTNLRNSIKFLHCLVWLCFGQCHGGVQCFVEADFQSSYKYHQVNLVFLIIFFFSFFLYYI